MKRPPGSSTHVETVEYADFWDEFEKIYDHSNDSADELEEDGAREEGEVEAEWLNAIGLGDLATAFRQGKVVGDEEVNSFVNTLPRHQAAAVERRVAHLNATIHTRQHTNKNRHQKTDIRELFPNVENSSTGTQSRSETPDSLDSIPATDGVIVGTPPSPDSEQWPSNDRATKDSPPPSHESGVPGFVSIFQQGTDSNIPSRTRPARSNNASRDAMLKAHWNAGAEAKGHVAQDSEIQMVSFRNVGTVYMRGYIPLEDLEIDHSTASPPKTKGFEAIFKQNQNSDELPGVSFPYDPLGRTELTDLSEVDVARLQVLVLIEFTAFCDEKHIAFRQHKGRKRRKEESPSSVFGVLLESLLERDKQSLQDRVTGEVPFIVYKILNHLETNCLNEEGLLRLAGHRLKTQQLRQDIESCLYSSPTRIDSLLAGSSPHDVAAVIKQFLRELPNPLLPYELADTFIKVGNLSSLPDQVRALNLLVLLLPPCHSATLKSLLQFLHKLSNNSSINKMSEKNVAMIIAPNIFLPRSTNASLNTEMNVAAITCQLTQLLIHYQDVLWIVPSELVQQIRLQRDEEYLRKNSKENNGPMKRLAKRMGGGKDREPMSLEVTNRGIICTKELFYVSAKQLGLNEFSMYWKDVTTAADVVLRLLTESMRRVEGQESNQSESKLKGRRGLGDLAPGSNLSCLLATSDKKITLDTHSLYEIGGNIGHRRLEADTVIATVYQVNNQATFELRCHHRNGLM